MVAEVTSEMGLPRMTVWPRWITSPLPSVISRTMYGVSSFPPLTAAQAAVSSCSGVTAMDWPKPIRAMSTRLHALSGITMPPASPRRSTPVGLPRPKASM